MDLSNMKVKELNALIEAAQKRLTEVKKSEETDARNKLIATAKELGFDAFQLLGMKATGDKTERARRPAPIKYRDTNSDQTWTGRGLKPKWLQAAMAAGKKLESFEIQS
jgi:DNA-binding protein H-NS